MNKRDWSDKDLRKHLIEARKELWTNEQIKRIAKWANFNSENKVLDVGCGLGYLGNTFADFFKNGSYTGIDISEKLIAEAKETFNDLNLPIKHSFRKMNSEQIDFDDNSFDIVMCQTLLMHLETPQKTLAEMYRVLKPGGTLLCFEPDNTSSELKETFNTDFNLSIEEKILLKTVSLYRIAGRLKLKRGDWGIGTKLPKLFYETGLVETEMLQNEKINFISPPYTKPHELNWKKNLEDRRNSLKKRNKINSIHKEEFLAGCGSEYLYKKYRSLINKYTKEASEKINISVESNAHFACSGPNFLFTCRGFKK